MCRSEPSPVECFAANITNFTIHDKPEGIIRAIIDVVPTYQCQWYRELELTTLTKEENSNTGINVYQPVAG